MGNPSSSDASSTQSRRELSRGEVEVIWNQVTTESTGSDYVRQAAHDSLIRGLFPKEEPLTHLAMANGPRPYRCPFRSTRRGGRFYYSTPERLVKTAIPWLLQYTERDQNRRGDHQAREAHKQAIRLTDLRQHATAELQALHKKLTHDLATHRLSDWVLSEPELRQLLALIEDVFQERS